MATTKKSTQKKSAVDNQFDALRERCRDLEGFKADALLELADLRMCVEDLRMRLSSLAKREGAEVVNRYGRR